MPPTKLHGLSLDDTLGAAFVGIVLAAFISGMTALQVVKYFQTDSGDKWYNKLSVVVLWVLDILNTIFVIISGYIFYVCYYGELHSAIGWSLKAGAWTLNIQIAFVHCLYAIRVWKLSKGSVMGSIIAIFVVVWAVAAASYAIIGFMPRTSFFDIHETSYYLWIPLAATSVLDLILAVTLCTYVKPNATYRNMTSVMTSLVRFTFANGLATSFCSALGLITFFAIPRSLIWMSCAIVMAKLYATSYLALLGSRRRWRERLAAPNMDVFGGEGFVDTYSVSLGARTSAEKLRSSWDRPSWESSRKDSMSHPSPLLPKPAHLNSSV